MIEKIGECIRIFMLVVNTFSNGSTFVTLTSKVNSTHIYLYFVILLHDLVI